ncbi:MAG: hypothetical protein EBU88_20450, partial [Acidobacteria bacterium]|nr:hypothetical protein [Acidobacteriota bacterium]
ITARQAGDSQYAAAPDVVRTLVVSPATATVALSSLTQDYNGTARSPVVTTTPSGLSLRITYNGSTTAPTNAGSYAVDATVTSPNYTGRAMGTMVVRPVAVQVAAQATNKVYGTVNPRLTAVVTGVPSAAPMPLYTLATTAATNSVVGSYPVTVSLGVNPNYTVTATSSTLSVTRAFLVVTAADASRQQGQPNPTFRALYQGWVAGDGESLISSRLTFSCTATATNAVGSYPIQVSGPATLSNYNVFYQAGVLTVRSGVQVVGRHVFYNQSSWDGGLADATTQDDAAVATDKSALRAGSRAAFANYTSYRRGINGVMVDIFGRTSSATPTAADFEFRRGNT